jgi:hypothetical protein
MRHLGSLLLALLLAPATWVLTGIGVSKFTAAQGDPAGLDIDLAVGLAAVLGAGVCYALLILPRVSPLGLVVAGLAFLGLVVWRVADLDAFNRAVPADFFDIRLALRNPADGYAALLAVPLLATLFSTRRWRRHDHPPAWYPDPALPAYQPAAQELAAGPSLTYRPSPYPGISTDEYPTVPDLPTAGHPPPYQQPQQASGQGHNWPFTGDTGTGITRGG